MRGRVVVALGGNALSGAAIVDEAAENVAALVLDGYEVVVVHGNGPQVGELLLDQEARGPGRPPALPLDQLVAMTQAQLGYLIQREVEDVLVAHGDHTDVVTVVTEVVVDRDDPEFDEPTKPVGPWYDTRPDDDRLYVQRSNGRWRRVVPSPEPRHVVERAALRAIVKDGIVPICGGGGGIPVVREGNRLAGTEAVIDKDLTAALIAADLAADALVLLTDVPHVERDHGTESATPLALLTTGDARRMLPGLPTGSMRPKVRAAIRVAEGGRDAVIGALGDTMRVLAGESGTRVVSGPAGDGPPGTAHA